MPTYDKYPAVDGDYNFPPEILKALAENATFSNQLIAAFKDALINRLDLVTDYVIGSDQEWTDLNTFNPIQSGIARVLSTALNRPEETSSYMVLHLRDSSERAVQIAVQVSGTRKMYVRTKGANVWNSWVVVVDQNNLDSRVSGLVNELNLITADDPRVLQLGDETTFAIVDSEGYAIAEFDSKTGKATIPDVVTRRSVIAGMTIIEQDDGIFRFVDSDGYRLFEVNAHTGKVYIGDLDKDSNIGNGGSSGGPVIDRVLFEIVAGQSNGAARGLPYGPRLDPTNPRIKMALWSNQEVDSLVPATVPVSSQAMLTTAGYGVGDVVARRLSEAQPSTVVVQLNVAKGGSAVVFDTANGVWAVDYAGSNTHLLPIAKAAITKTRQLIAAAYPGLPVDIQMVWHQGESDGSISYQPYHDALMAVFQAFRDHVGDQTMPIVMGGTVPEVSTATEELNIMGAQMQLQADMQYTAFAFGVHNGGGSSAIDDIVHYNRQGVERLGNRMYEALRRAYVNVNTSIPIPSLDVSAYWRKSEGLLDIEWSFPFCRVTDFSVQYRVDGGSWVSVTDRDRKLDTKVTVTNRTAGSQIEVRVATINEVGQSAYTVPVFAIGPITVPVPESA